jgi:hypothetical protein
MITVKDLIEMLGKCNPDAIVCVSEKRGRGGALGNEPTIYEGVLSECSDSESGEEPAIEITCNY